MKWISVIGITIVVAILAFYEWPKMKKDCQKEKMAFITITTIGWLLAIVLLFFPDLPGPTHLIVKIFKPLGQVLVQE
ncbi:hypothetical protein [Fictibacillus enclensis]|uniref:hypothetical protein n=1 Tax=Fictibacillus enclensis TaxID=1017270 RepID=UPI0024C00D49|nr:hypothetical protein [Fictibacillus enclensis]WHY73543.1 hypothetical protein QNH15_06420 [Fictibacillus enclensis]